MSTNDASHPDGDLQRALARHRAGDLAGAERLFGQVLARAPDHPVAPYHLGLIALQQGRAAEAAARLADAAAARPDDPGIQFNRGLALKALERVDEAAACYERAIALAPGFADAHVNLGNLRLGQGQLDAARACYERALVAAPDHVGAHNNLGTVLRELGDAEAAVAAHTRALARNPRHAGALSNLGTALAALGRLDEAAARFHDALALAPGLLPGDLVGTEPALIALALAPVLSQLVHIRQKLCAWDGLAALQAALVRMVEHSAAVPPFTLLSIPSTPAQQQLAARRWAARETAGAAPLAVPRPAPSDGRVRIGYLSSDFHEHPVAYLIPELLERHDRDRFAITGYSIGPDDGGPSRRRVVDGCDAVVDLTRLGHADAARRIAADGIDILVDLNGHTAGGRLRILAHRPAPVQVNYLGYPGTMGADFIDYVVVDPVLVTPGNDAWFDEQLVLLPHSYQANDSRRPVAGERPRRADAGLPDDGFVFCCFNAAYKLTPDVVDVWLRLLATVPGSVLWLLAGTATATTHLHDRAAARGIDPARLVFAPHVRLPAHLARQPLADLYLDTLPYNGHTTAADALWSGVPLVTLMGETFPGRVGASLLTALGMPELITRSVADYEGLALALARDPARLGALRARLQAARTTAPLFDMARYTRDLECAYAIMTARQRAGAAPAPIIIEPS